MAVVGGVTMAAWHCVAIVVGVCEQLMTVVGGGSCRQCGENGRGDRCGGHGTLWPCEAVANV